MLRNERERRHAAEKRLRCYTLKISREKRLRCRVGGGERTNRESTQRGYLSSLSRMPMPQSASRRRSSFAASFPRAVRRCSGGAAATDLRVPPLFPIPPHYSISFDIKKTNNH